MELVSTNAWINLAAYSQVVDANWKVANHFLLCPSIWKTKRQIQNSLKWQHLRTFCSLQYLLLYLQYTLSSFIPFPLSPSLLPPPSITISSISPFVSSTHLLFSFSPLLLFHPFNDWLIGTALGIAPVLEILTVCVLYGVLGQIRC